MNATPLRHNQSHVLEQFDVAVGVLSTDVYDTFLGDGWR
jgi:hypothetical protein